MALGLNLTSSYIACNSASMMFWVRSLSCSDSLLAWWRRAQASGETGDVGGIIFIFADFGDGLEEERADEAIGAVARIGLVGASDGGAELFGVFDEAEELFAFGLVVEPAGVGGGVPAGEGAFAEALRGDGLIGVAAPEEGVGFRRL